MVTFTAIWQHLEFTLKMVKVPQTGFTRDRGDLTSCTVTPLEINFNSKLLEKSKHVTSIGIGIIMIFVA